MEGENEEGFDHLEKTQKLKKFLEILLGKTLTESSFSGIILIGIFL